MPGFLKFFYEKCVCVPTYLCLSVQTDKFLSGKYSLYIRDKGPINPTTLVSFGMFLFQAKKRVWPLATDIESGFHSGLFWCSPTEKHLQLKTAK